MADPKGFMKVARKDAGNRPVHERIADYSEVEQVLNSEDRALQASRCMDCGIPFCQWGCPVDNLIPEWNDKLYRGDWKAAIDLLHSTNNFPEFTGRICPAPCEHSCVLNIGEEPVTIRENEVAIVEKAFAEGYIQPQPPTRRTGKTVAVIGSGPAGMAAADLLNKAGHTVTLFEKDEKPGGLLRYGIPDFKLNKYTIDRRIRLMSEEGVKVKCSMDIGKDITSKQLSSSFDAVCLTIGAMHPRDLPVPGRELDGVHFAMDFLTQQNRLVDGQDIPVDSKISAKNRHVLVIGGGDTGSDCVGTSIRQKAKSVTQIEILPKPTEKREQNNPWPFYGNILKTSTSHQEGCERRWNISTIQFNGSGQQVVSADIEQVEWIMENGTQTMRPVPGTRETLQADLVLLAMGFVHPVLDGLVSDLGLKLTDRKNISVNSSHMSSVNNIFAAGDAITGASLVVNAIASGRRVAGSIHKFLTHS
ncbi:MAG: glutamate synthase subunit beta [Bacteroidales bacterium]|nr:glutamate synthase subunit beta [Bacteroidales bacterium]